MSSEPNSPSASNSPGDFDPQEAKPGGASTPAGHPPSEPSTSAYGHDFPLPEELQKMLEGQYLVESFIGQGGMGAVYKGLQLPLKRSVAIKIMRKGAGAEFDCEERFKREAYAMAALTHPNIVQVYDCGDAGENALFISMELVEGGDLATELKKGKLEPERALTLIRQICDALQCAHEHGIVHRDVKPGNTFITKDGKAKVADFGLAKTLDAESFMTQTGVGMGTPDYAAPEQREGSRNLDHRADIYALGVMMYQMLTGVLPRGAYRPPSQRAAIDPRLDKIVFKAMEHERAARYQSAAALKSALEGITGPGSGTAPPLQEAEGDDKTLSVPLHASVVWATPDETEFKAPVAESVMIREETRPPGPALAPAPSAPLKKGMSVGMIAAGAFVLALLAGGGWWMASLRRAGPADTGAASDGVDMAHSPTIQSATLEAPYVNTLGMKFVPVPIMGGPTDKERVLFSVWHTRVQDYEVFAKETGHEWQKPDFEQGPAHPAVMVSWEDAKAFCAWLTKRERNAGRLSVKEGYRLPRDHEWSCAAGIGAHEDATKPPTEKLRLLSGVYPWGTDWPPPNHAGNYASEELRPLLEAGKYASMNIRNVIPGYRDGYATTSPVGSYAANPFGLFDMGGNVSQWCDAWLDPAKTQRVLRGRSWVTHDFPAWLKLSSRFFNPHNAGNSSIGFRCVLAPITRRSDPAAR